MNSIRVYISKLISKFRIPVHGEVKQPRMYLGVPVVLVGTQEDEPTTLTLSTPGVLPGGVPLGSRREEEEAEGSKSTVVACFGDDVAAWT